MKTGFLCRCIGVFLFFVTTASPFAVASQGYPTAPITIVVPWPPGGGADVLGRIVATGLSERLGQPVVVENRPGADNIIATRHVARSKADGHTLLLASSNAAVNATLHPDTESRFQEEFVPIINIGVLPTILVVTAEFPAQTVPALVELIKRNKPNEFSYAFTTRGSASHVSAIQFARMTEQEILGVSYKGSPQATTDLLGGHVDMMFNVASPLIGPIKSGKLRALFVLAEERLPAVPDIPTSSEAGFPGLTAGMWHGLVAPAGTPEPVVQKIYSTVSEILKDPAVVEQMNSQGMLRIGADSSVFRETIRHDIKWYAELFGSSSSAQ